MGGATAEKTNTTKRKKTKTDESAQNVAKGSTISDPLIRRTCLEVKWPRTQCHNVYNYDVVYENVQHSPEQFRAVSSKKCRRTPRVVVISSSFL